MEIDNKESTFPFKFLRADSAIFFLSKPSKEKGVVITPIVKMPRPFESSAIIGEAPEPVPPPRPQVTKTISAPFKFSKISCLDSSADFLPKSISMPVPRPPVIFFPIKIFLMYPGDPSGCPLEKYKACASVLIANSSTFCICNLAILRIVLDPEPPTPTTLICGFITFFLKFKNQNIKTKIKVKI